MTTHHTPHNQNDDEKILPKVVSEGKRWDYDELNTGVKTLETKLADLKQRIATLQQKGREQEGNAS